MTMTTKQKWDNILLSIITLAVIGFFIFAGMNMSKHKEPQTITFEVTGINNSEEAGTLVQLHLECVNYCTDKFYNSVQKLDMCYEQCESLGSGI